MNRNRVLTIGMMLVFATAISAQQATGRLSDSLPGVTGQLKILTGKLELTRAQQKKIKPILQALHDATAKIMDDNNLSQEERLAKVRPERMKADDKIRQVLNDDQKKKLDAYEQGPHHEMHGDLEGKKN